jgi:hypothetical protein
MPLPFRKRAASLKRKRVAAEQPREEEDPPADPKKQKHSQPTRMHDRENNDDNGRNNETISDLDQPSRDECTMMKHSPHDDVAYNMLTPILPCKEDPSDHKNNHNTEIVATSQSGLQDGALDSILRSDLMRNAHEIRITNNELDNQNIQYQISELKPNGCTNPDRDVLHLYADGITANQDMIFHCLYLEEEMTMLNMITESLGERTKQIMKEIEDAEKTKDDFIRQSTSLRRRLTQLSEQQTKQLELQNKIISSIAKLRNQVVPIESLDLTPEQIELIAASEDFVASTFIEQESVIATANTEKNDPSKHEKDASFMESFYVHQLSNEGDKRYQNTLLLSVPLTWTADKTLFWNNRRDLAIAEYNFLASITSKRVLKSILDITALDILALDRIVTDGTHRRQSMWNTCLDVRTLQSHGRTCSKSEPHISIDDAPSENGKSILDPNLPLCPYELSGVCADPDCYYQHFQRRKQGSIVPRELIPLPKLDIEKRRTQAARKKQQFKKCSPQSQTHGIFSPHRQMPTRNEMSLGSEETEYVALPNADDDNFFFSGDIDSHEEDAALPWWMPKDQNGIKEKVQDLSSVESFLQLLGIHCTEKDSVQCFSFQVVSCNLTELCRSTCALLDCIAFAVHAGRFDIAEMALKIATQMHYHSDGPKSCWNLTIFSEFISILETTMNDAFAYGKIEESSSAQVAFEVQLIFAFHSIVFEQFFHLLSSNEDCMDDSSASILTEQLSRINRIPLFSPSAFSSSRYDEKYGDIISLLSLIENVFIHNKTDPKPFSIVVDGIFETVFLSTLLKDAIVSVESLTCLRDNVVGSVINFVQKLFRDEDKEINLSNSVATLKFCIIVAFTVFGTLENVANRIPTDDVIRRSFAELRQLYMSLDRLVMLVHDFFDATFAVNLLLCPVLSANIALACTIKLYEKAHSRLIGLLNYPVVCNEDEDNIFTIQTSIFSEYLWSQLIQLTGALTRRMPPVYEEHSDRLSISLPKETEEIHDQIASHVKALGVFPHHVSLLNDWNLTFALGNLPTERSDGFFLHCRLLHESLLDFSEPRESFAFKLNNCVSILLKNESLQLLDTRGPALQVKHPIPLSILVAGPLLSELELSDIGLNIMPSHFGHHFPNLKVC